MRKRREADRVKALVGALSLFSFLFLSSQLFPSFCQRALFLRPLFLVKMHCFFSLNVTIMVKKGTKKGLKTAFSPASLLSSLSLSLSRRSFSLSLPLSGFFPRARHFLPQGVFFLGGHGDTFVIFGVQKEGEAGSFLVRAKVVVVVVVEIKKNATHSVKNECGPFFLLLLRRIFYGETGGTFLYSLRYSRDRDGLAGAALGGRLLGGPREERGKVGCRCWRRF